MTLQVPVDLEVDFAVPPSTPSGFGVTSSPALAIPSGLGAKAPRNLRAPRGFDVEDSP